VRALIVLRCGRGSLHENWISDGPRNWDLVLCPYEPIDAHGLDSNEIPGLKWDGLQKFFCKWQGWRDYDYICLPDDDLTTDMLTWNEFFSACARSGAELAQPALIAGSHFSHFITLQNRLFQSRWVNFVEIMVPCFSREFFAEVLRTLPFSHSGTGFGLDFLWPAMLDGQKILISDATPIMHTRPVGSLRNSRIAALAEADLRYFINFGLPTNCGTHAGIDLGGIERRSDQDSFSSIYAEGYRHLGFEDAVVERTIITHPPVYSAEVRSRIAAALTHRELGAVPMSRGKPSRSSSLSEWSVSLVPEIEAAGGNDGRLNGNGGFHTSKDDHPWWDVDLGCVSYIREIVIYNRLDYAERFVSFDVLASTDGVGWHVLHSQQERLLFGGLDGNPFRRVFLDRPTARFVMIRSKDSTFLHLDQIEVFADPIPHDRSSFQNVGIFSRAADSFDIDRLDYLGRSLTADRDAPACRAGVEACLNLAQARGRRPAIVAELTAALYGDEPPLDFADPGFRDDGYPHTNLQPAVIESVLDVAKPMFWLELGSMLGGSAILAAAVVKRRAAPTGIVCVDPFCGDVNMWAWEQGKKRAGEWRFLRTERGRPTIFERFVANVDAAGHGDIILPITATSMVGMRLLQRLLAQGLISRRPEVIYLDSAHEANETLLELHAAWDLLTPDGILFGDDWSWEAVRTDVLRFAATIQTRPERLLARHGQSHPQNGVVLMENGQWALVK
jgi:predicted O-methyltransferase YrrM